MARPPLSAPSLGQSQSQTMARPRLSELSVLPLPYLELGDAAAAFPSAWNARLPVSQCLRPCHTPAPHPQPHPASLVLGHHDNHISKWEGLESPHILPPPTRVPLRPTFCGSWIHMCGGSRAPDVGGARRGHTGPWGSLFSFYAHCQAGTTVQMSCSWVQGVSWGQFSFIVSFSGFPLFSQELYVCNGVTPEC